MYFVDSGSTVSQIARADAIACNYFISLTKFQKAYWEFFLFVGNSDQAKKADFWIANESNLAVAIANEKYPHKTDLEKSKADRHCIESAKTLLYSAKK